VAGVEAGVEGSVVAVLVKEVERVVGGLVGEEAGLGVVGWEVKAVAGLAAALAGAVVAGGAVLAAAVAAVEVLAAAVAGVEALAAVLVVVVETAQ
jgi:hypothetical protein